MRELVWQHADVVLWLDPDWGRNMARIVGRTVRRAAFREELWNGNRERLTNFLSMDPEKSILAWAWTRHSVYRERYAAAMADPELAHLRFFRVRDEQDLQDAVAWLAAN